MVWMVFFDKNDALTQYDRYNELKALKQSTGYYKKQIDNCRQEIKDLQSNPHYLEKIAREKYYLKKDNEDIYLIENK